MKFSSVVKTAEQELTKRLTLCLHSHTRNCMNSSHHWPGNSLLGSLVWSELKEQQTQLVSLLLIQFFCMVRTAKSTNTPDFVMICSVLLHGQKCKNNSHNYSRDSSWSFAQSELQGRCLQFNLVISYVLLLCRPNCKHNSHNWSRGNSYRFLPIVTTARSRESTNTRKHWIS